jgi:hypothetical protein
MKNRPGRPRPELPSEMDASYPLAQVFPSMIKPVSCETEALGTFSCMYTCFTTARRNPLWDQSQLTKPYLYNRGGAPCM